MAAKKINFTNVDSQATIRFLLGLWNLGGEKQEVKRGELNRLIVTNGNKIADYNKIIIELQSQNAIALSKKGFILVVPKGLELLAEGLKSPEFRFEGTIVGSWIANALLKWIAENYTTAVTTPLVMNGKKTEIKSYTEFKKITLDVYEKLNRDYSFDHLVPIYRIRRTIGEQVNRSNFSEWLLEMQADDILQLQGGSVEDSAPDKIEDSITTKVNGLRCYAQLIS